MFRQIKLSIIGKKSILTILFISFSLLVSWDIQAQDKSQLVFTKVMIDKKTSQVWFEILNPTSGSIYLKSFRISGIKTINILPPDILKSNGTILNPGERIIICADKESFIKHYGTNIRTIEIHFLKNIGDGGFVAMNHLEGIENEKNLVRFGNKERSLSLSGIVSDDQVLNITNDGMSYSRTIDASGALSNWTKTIPEPGK